MAEDSVEQSYGIPCPHSTPGQRPHRRYNISKNNLAASPTHWPHNSPYVMDGNTGHLSPPSRACTGISCRRTRQRRSGRARARSRLRAEGRDGNTRHFRLIRLIAELHHQAMEKGVCKFLCRASLKSGVLGVAPWRRCTPSFLQQTAQMIFLNTHALCGLDYPLVWQCGRGTQHRDGWRRADQPCSVHAEVRCHAEHSRNRR